MYIIKIISTLSIYIAFSSALFIFHRVQFNKQMHYITISASNVFHMYFGLDLVLALELNVTYESQLVPWVLQMLRKDV